MNTVYLPAILDLRAASPLAAEILQARGRHLTIDASNVQTVGALCVQILLSARATWAADAMSFNLVHPSETFLESLGVLGIPFDDISEQGHAR